METAYYSKQNSKSRKKLLTISLFVGVFFALSYFLINILFSQSSSQEILGKEQVQANILPSPTPAKVPSNELEKSVLGALIGTRGSYGIAIKNLKTQESYFLNKHISYDSASLYKLWVMAETFRQIKDGILKEDQILSEDVKVLNEKHKIASESAQLQEGTITLSVGDALNKMIVNSDNYAALLLSSKIRLSNVANFLKQNGLNESSIGTISDAPSTTAYDTALFFEKLYNSEIIDAEYGDKMLELLKAQKLNNKIPRYLPQDLVIAHKTGELDPFTHDAGIVYGLSGDYIIVVLSKSEDPDAAENRIAEVSEAVFNYFQNK